MLKRILILLFISTIFIFGQPAESLNSSEIKLALKKLNTLGTVLYVAAHPDDENTAFLSYFNFAEHLRTGYLSFTRGDGGQNLIGEEQGDLLGVIRTQELLQARNIDGTEQFFARAVDFGYSKTPEETLEKWGKEEMLSDIVWIIRKFKPDAFCVESLFFAANAKTAMMVGQARGVIVVTAAEHKLKIIEVTPLQVKISATGYGKADKRQVQNMMMKILHLKKIPKPDDAADAVAIAWAGIGRSA